MINIEVERDTDLSADIVWEEMKHFDRVLNWVPGGDQSTISIKGKGIGTVSYTHLTLPTILLV